MSVADQWEMLGREGREYADGVFDRIQANNEARNRKAREAREAYEENVPRYAGWDAAAKYAAMKDALLAEVRRLDPTNPLVNAELRKVVGDRGRKEFIKGGRKDIDDALIITRGIARIR
jgi:hypothetical protein